MKILFTGGGTAGHIFPIIAVAREIKKIYYQENIEFFYVGPKDDFSENLLSQEGFKIKIISAGKIRRYFNLNSFFQNLLDIFIRMPKGFIQAFWHVYVISPDLIFSKGGYGSFPVVLAGWLLLTPIFLHESDSVPGLVNKLTKKLAVEVFLSFPIKENHFKKGFAVGNPIRKEILNGDKKTAKELFRLTGEKPVILILGGSQGSQRINDVILTVLAQFLENFELIHQTGQKNFKEVEAESKVILDKNLQKYYHPVPFLNEEQLKHAFAAADLVVARAGSGTIFEIAAVKKPSILIPLPESAQNHQLKNAYLFAEWGCCWVIEEANLTPHFFLEQIKYLFSDPEKLKKMSQACQYFSKIDAGTVIAKYLIDYLIQ